MDKVTELKEIIVNLKIDLIEERIPNGHCPYSYYTPSVGRFIDCTIGCGQCRKIFMRDIEKDIRKQVDKL